MTHRHFISRWRHFQPRHTGVGFSRNTDTFGYNDRGEVTSATIAGGSQSYATASYGYDEIGNSTDWTANNLNQYTQFIYDLDGNLLSDGVRTFTYDAANRLKTVSSNGVLLLTNFYDAKSRRVRKVTSEYSAVFFYDDWNLIEERIACTNGTTSTIHYFWGKDLSGTLRGAGGVGGLLYLTVDGDIYIPCYDANGNVTRYLDSSGNTVATYTYDAFGNILSQSGPLADIFRHRFSPKYFDVETGLYYYGYRFYHPTLMRWLTRDPIEEDGGVNLYATCCNSLIDHFDVLGMDNASVVVEGLGAGWAGSTITLKGRTAVQLNGELYYLSMSHQRGMYIPKNGPTSTLYLFKADNVRKGLRLDYHELPINSNNPPEWHINVDGHSGIAKVANSKSLNHTTSPRIKALGKTVTVFKYGGRICFVAGIGMSAVDIYRADNRVREVVRQVGGWSGAYIGGRVGASLGARGGVAAAVVLGQTGPQVATPEEVVTVPVFGAIGGIAGGVVGGISGAFFGTKTTETVYDWVFTPLEKEEWEVGCEPK